ncbi:MAG: Gfo/Idh/MocA family oxidoreductase [Verrucomicrobiales bacterium]|nr:Gfo/Idh/MocA family oxidoreductase [Verrucomicrobiales bacterium]
MKRRWKIAGINFDHFHMGDLLRMVQEHPDAEIAGISDLHPERMEEAQRNFGLGADQVFTDYRTCMERTRPDLVILCPAAARHAEWTEKVAPFGVPILMEKPFAASLAEADRMIAAMQATGQPLAINWPLCWYPSHATAFRLAREGAIGQITEVHSYGGNRGPLWHGADKIELEPTPERKAASWFYKKSEGGGSLLDYLGYGATLGTWFLNNARPEEVTGVFDTTSGLEVDEHSITVARYGFGMSKFETRWGTFTDPWTHQPQPKCGFVLKGTEGTLSSYDGEPQLFLQTRSHPEGAPVQADTLQAPHQNPIQYFLHCLETGTPVEGPLSPEVSRIGQQIVDTAYRSAQEKRTLPLCQ